MKTLAKYHTDNKQIILANPHLNRRKTIVEVWYSPLGQFTVRAGLSSDYSYTGMIDSLEGINSVDDVIQAIYSKHSKGEIFK